MGLCVVAINSAPVCLPRIKVWAGMSRAGCCSLLVNAWFASSRNYLEESVHIRYPICSPCWPYLSRAQMHHFAGKQATRKEKSSCRAMRCDASRRSSPAIEALCAQWHRGCESQLNGKHEDASKEGQPKQSAPRQGSAGVRSNCFSAAQFFFRATSSTNCFLLPVDIPSV